MTDETDWIVRLEVRKFGITAENPYVEERTVYAPDADTAVAMAGQVATGQVRRCLSVKRERQP